MGVSVRRLWGWEPAEVTTVTDSSGAVVSRSVVVREPEFSPDDVALMLAVRQKDAAQYNDEITVAEAFDPNNAHAFRATSAVNYAEKARLDQQEADRKANKDGNFNGRIYGVTRAPVKPRSSEDIRQMMRGNVGG